LTRSSVNCDYLFQNTKVHIASKKEVLAEISIRKINKIKILCFEFSIWSEYSDTLFLSWREGNSEVYNIAFENKVFKEADFKKGLVSNYPVGKLNFIVRRNSTALNTLLDSHTYISLVNICRALKDQIVECAA